MKNKVILTIITILLLIHVATAINHTAEPENATYEPNKNYTFSLNIDELNNSIIFRLSKNNMIILNRTQVNYNETRNAYFVNIDDLSSGNYNYLWEEENETNTTKIVNDTYTIQKSTPELELKLNSNAENKTINETDELTINANVKTNQGILELYVNDELIDMKSSENETNITINTTYEFETPGTYNVKAKYNETENYTAKEIKLNVYVKEKLLIQTSKEEYNLGDDATYLINAPINKEVEIEIWRNDTTNPGFEIRDVQETILIDELNININNTLWKQITLDETKKSGKYKILAKIKNTTIERQANYEVINSMDLTVTGNTKLETNEETTITASAKKGISPYTYTWTLPDDTTKTGTEIKVKFPEKGNKEIKITAEDSEGNTKNKTITLDVKKYYDLTIEVRDNENNLLQNANVEIDELSESKKTDNTGKAKFKVPEDEYTLLIYASNFELKTENVDLSKDTSMTIKLNKEEQQTTSKNKKITLQKPLNDVTTNTNNVEFEAKINLDTKQTCKLLLADKESEWLVELARKENVETETITYKEQIENGDYKWQITCGDDESEIRYLTIKPAEFSTTNTNIDGTIDAGELRRQIETAQNNLDNLDVNTRKAADAMNMKEILRISLRDYERILRDINSLSLRRDLTTTQKEEKLYEYKEQINKIEKSTPLLIELVDFEEFIAYPKKEEIKKITETYLEKRNIQGNFNEDEVEQLQNNIRTRTYAATATIKYINGNSEDVSLIHKTIEYTGNITKEQFILEKIPQNMNNNLTVIETHDTILKNEIIRLEKPETITYYSKGHQKIEELKQSDTILLSEKSFSESKTRTTIPGFTSFVTLNQTDMDATTSLVLILILLIIAYLFYAFDLKHKLVNIVKNIKGDKKLKELRSLVNDAKDYLDTKNIERANLIYKEIKLLYEKSSRKTKNEIYKEITDLINLLNEKYLEYLIQKTEENMQNKEQQQAIKTYNKIIEVYQKIEPEVQKTYKELILKLNKNIQQNNK